MIEQIKKNAPKGATHWVMWTSKVRYINMATKQVYLDTDNSWHTANIMVLQICKPL